jgi:hypothetical protein
MDPEAVPPVRLHAALWQFAAGTQYPPGDRWVSSRRRSSTLPSVALQRMDAIPEIRR